MKIKYQHINIAVPEKKITTLAGKDEVMSADISRMIIKPDRSLRGFNYLIRKLYELKYEYAEENMKEPKYLLINEKDYRALVWYLCNERGHIHLANRFIGMDIIITDVDNPKVIGSAESRLMNIFRERKDKEGGENERN